MKNRVIFGLILVATAFLWCESVDLYPLNDTIDHSQHHTTHLHHADVTLRPASQIPTIATTIEIGITDIGNDSEHQTTHLHHADATLKPAAHVSPATTPDPIANALTDPPSSNLTTTTDDDNTTVAFSTSTQPHLGSDSSDDIYYSTSLHSNVSDVTPTSEETLETTTIPSNFTKANLTWIPPKKAQNDMTVIDFVTTAFLWCESIDLDPLNDTIDHSQHHTTHLHHADVTLRPASRIPTIATTIDEIGITDIGNDSEHQTTHFHHPDATLKPASHVSPATTSDPIANALTDPPSSNVTTTNDDDDNTTVAFSTSTQPHLGSDSSDDIYYSTSLHSNVSDVTPTSEETLETTTIPSNFTKANLTWIPPKKAQNDMTVIDFIASIGSIFWIIIIAVGFFRRDMFFDTCLRGFHSESLTISDHGEAAPLLKSPSFRPRPSTAASSSHRESSAAETSNHAANTNLKSFSKTK
uniref:Uncharacterized protein n=1 Tax=Panagrolaimus sp. ES5 TaxID=591445 RepID=A0AC34G374_9BILA